MAAQTTIRVCITVPARATVSWFSDGRRRMMDATQLRLHADMEERHWWFLGRRRIMQGLVERLMPGDTRQLVVDVGCGTGGNIGSLTGTYETVGIDTAPEAIELAIERFPGTRFWCGTLADSPPDLDDGAGLYLLMDVLEHVHDDIFLLSTLLSRASVGTHVLITVPAHEHLWSGHDQALEHYRRYDAARLSQVWDGLPVEVRLLSYFNYRLYPFTRAVRWLNGKLGRSTGQEGTDLRMPVAPLNGLLSTVLGGERRVLEKALAAGKPGPYRTGVSLLAVLRLTSNDVAPRRKPVNISPDPVDRP